MVIRRVAYDVLDFGSSDLRTIEAVAGSVQKGWVSLLRVDRVRIIVIFLASSLVSPVYAVDEFPDYSVRPAACCAVTARTADVIVGVQPVEDLQDQETYFRTKLIPKGFLPVFVVIQNGSTCSLLLDKTKITYGATGSGVTTPNSGSKAGESLALALVPFVGAFAATKVIKNASLIQQNILKKELQSTTLSPGISVHGFLYIPVPKEIPRQIINLRVPLLRAGSDETTVLDLVF